MTEKRFTFSGNDEEPLIKDNITGKEYPTEENSLMELLNELHEKNHNLRESRRELITANNQYRRKLNELHNENKELKARYNRCIEEMDSLAELNDKFYKENKKLKELVSEVDNELEIRDIVCGAGKFRLEEWGKHRYHQFYKGDEELEDESVVIMLMELEKENKELKAKVDDKEVAVEVECEKLMQKVFDLIDEKIKLYSHKPVSAPISQPMSVNFDADVDRLARLSELEALKEELTR